MPHRFADRTGDQIAVPAVFMRGGASKGLMFHARDLPEDRAERDRFFLAALGSPDPHGRQLDGMGGGSSSLSKVCIIEPSRDFRADIDYTFAKVDIREAKVFYDLACGSMASAVGPFAVDEGLVAARLEGETTVRIRDANTDRIIVSRFAMRAGRAAVRGDLAVDGVAGTGAAVRLQFLEPGGAATGRLLPTGRPLDIAEAPGSGGLEFSCVDAANPVVFVHARALGLKGIESPEEMARLDGLPTAVASLRRRIADALGGISAMIGDARGLPRLAVVCGPVSHRAGDGRAIAAPDADVVVRMMAGNLPHGGLPLTTALCLGAACRIAGTIPHRLCAGGDPGGPVRIAHPNGVWRTGVRTRDTGAGLSIDLIETAMTQRRLFEGRVFAPRPTDE